MSRTRSKANRGRWIAGQPCHYACGGPATTVDHVVPKALGGAFAYYNLVPACLTCNGAKANLVRLCDCDWCERARAIHWAREPMPNYSAGVPPVPPVGQPQWPDGGRVVWSSE